LKERQELQEQAPETASVLLGSAEVWVLELGVEERVVAAPEKQGHASEPDLLVPIQVHRRCLAEAEVEVVLAV
jgi:hypothetical protein